MSGFCPQAGLTPLSPSGMDWGMGNPQAASYLVMRKAAASFDGAATKAGERLVTALPRFVVSPALRTPSVGGGVGKGLVQPFFAARFFRPSASLSARPSFWAIFFFASE
jgi:hypothetical protein